MYISQTCPQCSSPPRHCHLSNPEQSVLESCCHIPLSHSPCGWRPSLWAVIGQRDEAEEWPPWQWHCIISDRGHRVRGERGLRDTTKKQSSAISFLQSSRLSVKCSTLFMFAAKGSEVHANWGWKAPSLWVALEQLEFLLLVLSREQCVWHRSESSIKERDYGGDSLFMIRSLSFLDSKRQKI